MSYPWVEDPSGSGPEPRFPWEDDPDTAVGIDPIYRPGGERRIQVLRRVDPWSVLKVSLALYMCFLAVILIVGSGLWLLGRQIGFVGNIEAFIEDLYFPGTFEFQDFQILTFAAIVGPIFAVVAALVTTAAAGFYNVVARLTGGLEVTVREEETD